ncbi:MAG: 2'-5' RNA ligase family protein, partial [Wenzhouxiangella sp.]
INLASERARITIIDEAAIEKAVRAVSDAGYEARTLDDEGGEAAQAVAGLSTGFELCLDRFGWFPGARVVWLGGEAPPAAADLATGLGGAMQALDLKFDPRPFKPHVTLLRRVRSRPAMPRPSPLAWQVGEFSLIESISGQPYQVLRTWRV